MILVNSFLCVYSVFRVKTFDSLLALCARHRFTIKHEGTTGAFVFYGEAMPHHTTLRSVLTPIRVNCNQTAIIHLPAWRKQRLLRDTVSLPKFASRWLSSTNHRS